MNRTNLNRSEGRRPRRPGRRLTRAAVGVLAAAAITILAGCPTPTQEEFTYTATVTVTGTVAAGLDITVTDPVGGGDSVVGETTFPWTYQAAGSVDFENPYTVSFEVTGTVAPAETFTVEVTYREEHYTDPVTHMLFSETVTNDGSGAGTMDIQGAVVLPYVKEP
jgi:hypothetical protein